jgi:hypothetical protein
MVPVNPETNTRLPDQAETEEKMRTHSRIILLAGILVITIGMAPAAETFWPGHSSR